MNTSDFFKLLWLKAPLSWAIIRARECELLSMQKYSHPILEVGCGDGLVSQLVFSNKKGAVDLGIDLDIEELRRARRTGIYTQLKCLDITDTKFKANSFGTIFANGVLEHIPDLPKALKEISRLLKKNGRLITTSPTNNFSNLLFFVRIFNFFRVPRFASAYQRLLNHFFSHYHLLSKEEWQQLFNNSSLHLEYSLHYNSRLVTEIHDISLPLSLFTKITKRFFGTMTVFPQLRKVLLWLFLPIFTQVLAKHNENPSQNASIFLIAKKL